MIISNPCTQVLLLGCCQMAGQTSWGMAPWQWDCELDCRSKPLHGDSAAYPNPLNLLCSVRMSIVDGDCLCLMQENYIWNAASALMIRPWVTLDYQLAKIWRLNFLITRAQACSCCMWWNDNLMNSPLCQQWNLWCCQSGPCAWKGTVEGRGHTAVGPPARKYRMRVLLNAWDMRQSIDLLHEATLC